MNDLIRGIIMKSIETILGVETRKEFGDGHTEVIRKEFRNKYDLYKYTIVDYLATYMESAREELEDNEFTALCLQICGFMAEYFT